MFIFQIMVVIASALPNNSGAQHVLAVMGMYLFGIAYSPSQGPVPFVYAAESMPLYNRDFGMGVVTSINWLFNAVVALTWPELVKSFKVTGAYVWYAGWCFAGWWIVLLFVRETKDLALEQLTDVFQQSTWAYMAYGLKKSRWFFVCYLFRMRKEAKPIFLKNPRKMVQSRSQGDIRLGDIAQGSQERLRH